MVISCRERTARASVVGMWDHALSQGNRRAGASQCQTLFSVFVEFKARSCSTGNMPRRPRIEFEGAIYHVMARGNGRQQIVRDDHDRLGGATDWGFRRV